MTKILASTNRPGRGWLTAAFAVAALCLAATVAAPAIASERPTPPPADEASDDETLGTLPSVGAGTFDLDLLRQWRDARPSVYVEGPANEVFGALLHVEGQGTVGIADAGSGRIRFTLLGDLKATFERAAFLESGAIRVGVSLQSPIANVAVLRWAGATAHLGTLPVGATELPLAGMAANGAIDFAPIDVVTRYGPTTHVLDHFEAVGNLLVLSQSH